MEIRKTLNRNPVATTGVAIVLILAIAFLVYKQQRTAADAPATKAFYTVDDGQTTFEDDIGKAVPFDHDGAQAVRAHVFSCDDNKTRFVGFLEKHAAAKAAPADGGRPIRDLNSLIKAPKEPAAKWVANSSPEGVALIAGIRCPDGAGAAGGPVEVFGK